MAIYAAREIYRFARMAGFSPDQAVTMTAIALAESGGRTQAHNDHGEDSRGLWQINASAHPNLARRNLYDPLENAKAAFAVSNGGRDVSPWTTTHGGSSAAYTGYRAQAQAAAQASGDPAGLGVWSGSTGYGHPLAAGGGASSSASIGEPTALRTFLDSALAQHGDPYVWGAEAKVSNPDPHAFDCSELVQWAAGRAQVNLPDGSWLQYLALQQQDATISVDKALKTPGALLFSFSSDPAAGGGRPSEAHVAISLGDGRTIEARGRRSGIGSWSAEHRFNYAAVIPGISDGSVGAGAAGYTAAGSGLTATAFAADAEMAGAAADTDRDGLTDALEARLGLSATTADSDHDDISDGYELLKLHTDPKLADTDGDGVTDALELALGTNPLDPDSNQDGQLDGVSTPGPDTDQDGLSDALERLLRSDPTQIDSDGDGFTDGAEYSAGFDPANPASNPLLPAPTTTGSATEAASQALADHSTVDPTGHDPSWGLGDLGGA
jgi:cell wall-associated NlpC family hydrolase